MAESNAERAAREYGTFLNHTGRGAWARNATIVGGILLAASGASLLEDWKANFESEFWGVAAIATGVKGVASLLFRAILGLKEAHYSNNFENALSNAPRSERDRLRTLKWQYEANRI